MCGSEINQETDTQLIVHSPWPEGAKNENTIDEISFDFLNNYSFKQPTIKLITPKRTFPISKNSQIHVFSLLRMDNTK